MNEQRRQFFRIQDEGIICFEKFDQEDLVQFKKTILNQDQDQGQGDVFKQFFKFDSNLQSILLNNNTLSSDWVNIVELLNSKVNQLAKLLAPNYQTIFNQPPQPISLSADGIGMDYPSALPEGQWLKIDLILLPQYTYISALTQVVYCTKQDQISSAGYTLGLQLEVIRPQDTDRLIQHIMKKEAEWLKYRREQSL